MAGSARVDGGYVVGAEEFAAIVAALPTASPVMSPDLTGVEADPAYGEVRDHLPDRLADGHPSDDVVFVAVRHQGGGA